ncbi:MAG: TSUP family transporter [Methylococcaceae bacterium]|nr:TSUP family transporter [Methylococcaceae bacterium]
MPVDILITILITAIIQSVFGVGVLLFGTPILLILGYDFINALSVLLPVSIAINSLQIIKHFQYIDIPFYKHLLIYSIPFVIIFLFLVSTKHVNINLLVGSFLVLVALKNIFPTIEQKLEKTFKHEKIYFSLMGVIHGLTNLGGSLLTAIVHSKNHEKNSSRVTIAICYATFAFFQLITLLLIGKQFELSFAENMSFLQIGVFVFLITEEIVYNDIDNKKYRQFFSVFLLISGLLLIIK